MGQWNHCGVSFDALWLALLPGLADGGRRVVWQVVACRGWSDRSVRQRMLAMKKGRGAAFGWWEEAARDTGA